MSVHIARRIVQLLGNLLHLTMLPIADAFPLLQDRSREQELRASSTRIETAPALRPQCAGWGKPPVIALTERGKHEDSLWFSFFHEAGHIVLHPRRKSLIELEGADDDDGAESDANNFAKKTIFRGRQRQLRKDRPEKRSRSSQRRSAFMPA